MTRSAWGFMAILISVCCGVVAATIIDVVMSEHRGITAAYASMIIAALVGFILGAEQS